MIGSHNSMSYLPPKHWFWRLFTPFWRCQYKTIKEQIDAGVKFFDIRVVWDKEQDCWQFAHGLVRFVLADPAFVLTNDVLAYLEAHGCLYRIVLERGTEFEEARFRNWFGGSAGADIWWGSHPHCTAAIIKRGWYKVHISVSGYYSLQLADHSFVPFHSDKPWYRQLSWRMLCTPRLWANRHNTVENGWKEDKNTVHFYDFATELKSE
nr:MAG TPA: hypothetical protein [Bacteriophage sp.]